MASSYQSITSFESGRVEAVGIGESVIAIGIDDHLEIVTETQLDGISHGDRIVDVAVADRILVLSQGDLTAYSRDGNQIWQRPIEDAHAIAATVDGDCCGILGPDRFRAIDVPTGQDRFDVERTRPGGPDDTLVAVPSGFLIATWSFLTAVSSGGEIEFDRDLAAVIRSVGYCEDVVVAALQNDRLVGLDVPSGDSRWDTDLETTHVSPAGQTSVLADTATGIQAISSDGSTDPVTDLSSGDVYAATDGSVACTIRDGTVSTYALRREQVQIAVTTDFVEVGETIDIEVTNPSDRERALTLDVDVSACTLSPNERPVSVGPGETTSVAFPVTSVQSTGRAEVDVAIEGSVVQQESISVEDTATEIPSVAIGLEPTVIEDGVAELTLTVDNVGDGALDSVRVLETGSGTDLRAGEQWTTTVTRPYEPERRVTAGIEVSVGDRSREHAPTCTLPSPPAIDIESNGDALHATVTGSDSVTIVDQLVIELPGAGRVRTPVTIADDDVILVVPQYESGTARIGFNSIDVAEQASVRGSGLFTTSAGPAGPTGDRRDRSSVGGVDRTGSTDRLEPEDERTTAATAAGNRSEPPDTPTSTPTDDNPDTDAPSETRSTVDVGDAVSSKPAENESAEPDSNAFEGSQPSTASPSTGGSITATREIDGDAPAVGHVVRDRISVQNGGDSENAVTVVADDERIDLGPLEPGATVALSRAVAVGSSDELVLPSATIEVNGTVVDRIPERTLEVAGDGIDVRAAVDPTDGTVGLELENHRPRGCQLLGLVVGDHQESVGKRLEAGGLSTLTIPTDSTPSNADALEVSIAVRDDDGSEETIDALAAVSPIDRPSEADSEADTSEVLLGCEIGSETRAAGEYGSVVLVFENQSDRAVSNVSVDATGDPINETFYSPAHRELLEAGDWIEHFVDLRPDVDEPTFDAAVRYTVDDTEQEYSVRASGPAVDEEANWSDEHLSAWSIDRLEGSSGTGPELPPSLSTSFRTR
ncbi:hypothetical protein [Natronorubrum tibetense]|uniref:Uncharacterized protein n=1 Tax=Natronorubrum tibetense GA33 TaxID=1114856 RepID=L9W594_9EURY|nr:hypothetical protein [Natronorubrum tibetense]ELY44630.1 hypothetical protein C496_04520 [Natronorubrum tibetense GA33]